MALQCQRGGSAEDGCKKKEISRKAEMPA